MRKLKKLFIVLLCVVSITAICFAVSGCGEHTHTEEILPGLAATCTETGLTEGKKCSECGEILVKQEEIPALGHDLKDVAAQAATCTEKGHTAGQECTRCDYTTSEEISALGHDLKDVSAQAATCTEKGHTAGQECTRCDYTTSEEISALGHDLKDVAAQSATCTEKGHTAGQECTRCDYTTSEEIPALNHDYQFVWNNDNNVATYACSHDSDHTLKVTMTSVTTEATCTTDEGVKYVATVYDGEKVIATDEKITVKPDSALGHGYELIWNSDNTVATCVCKNDSSHTLAVVMTSETTDPTCTEDGFTVYTATVTAGEEVLLTESKTVVDTDSKTDHDLEAYVSEDGKGHYLKCDNCDYETEVESHTATDAGLIKGAEEHYYLCRVCAETYGNETHTYSINVSDGAEGHHHECECGALEADSQGTHSLSYVSDKAGKHYQVCADCGYQTTPVTCSLKYVSDENGHHQECEYCGYETETEAHEQVLTHTVGKEGHYHACSICGYNYNDVTDHNYSLDTIEQYDGTAHVLYCECGSRTVNQHVYDPELLNGWSYDETGHWVECILCGYVSSVYAHYDKLTGDETGHWYMCYLTSRASCGYTHGFVAHDNSFAETDENDNCVIYDGEDGKHYYKCTTCGELFGGEAHNNPEMDGENIKYYTVEDDTDNHYLKCADCGALYGIETHTYVYTQIDGENNAYYHTVTCNLCSYSFTENHNFNETGNECLNCGYETAHIHTDQADESGYYDGVCDTCGENMHWTYADGAVTAYTGEATEIIVPETFKVDGETQEINKLGKSNGTTSTGPISSTIVAIIIPGSIKTIGRYALAFATLTECIIQNGVETLDNGVFYRSGITSIAIPDSVTSLGTSLFGLCQSIVRADLGTGITTISSAMFNQCSNLETVIFRGKITTVATAFNKCTELKEVYFYGLSAEDLVPLDTKNHVVSTSYTYCYYETNPYSTTNDEGTLISETDNFKSIKGGWHYDVDGNVVIWQEM